MLLLAWADPSTSCGRADLDAAAGTLDVCVPGYEHSSVVQETQLVPVSQVWILPEVGTWASVHCCHADCPSRGENCTCPEVWNRVKQLSIRIGIRESAKVHPWQLHRSCWNMLVCIKLSPWIKYPAAFKNKTWTWAWLLMSVISAHRRLRQEASLDYSEFQTSPDCTVRLRLKTKTKERNYQLPSTKMKLTKQSSLYLILSCF